MKPLIYLAYANSDRDTERLPALQEEFEAVRTLLKKGLYAEHFLLKYDECSTLGKIKKVLQDPEERHLLEFFSYSGHASPKGLDVLDGKAHLDGLSGMLGDCPNLKAVLLNGCSTVGMVKDLFDKGVKLVIATHQKVDDHRAMDFAIAFFQRLTEEDCTIDNAYKAACDAVKYNPKYQVIFKSRGIKAFCNGNMDEEVWDIFYKKEESLLWTLPSGKTCLRAALALSPAQRGGSAASFPASMLTKEEAAHRLENLVWQEEKMANLCLLWGLSRKPFLGCCRADGGESAWALFQALIQAEDILFQHSGMEKGFVVRCWFNLPLGQIPISRSIEDFGDLLATLDNILAQEIARQIRIEKRVPAGFCVGIVAAVEQESEWQRIRDWADAFLDFSFVFHVVNEAAYSPGAMMSLFDAHTALGKDCFLAMEKPVFKKPAAPTAKPDSLFEKWAAKIPGLLHDKASAEDGSYQTKASLLLQFAQAYRELEANLTPDNVSYRNDLRECLELEQLFYKQLEKMANAAERELPDWIRAYLETGHEVLAERLFYFLEAKDSDAYWDAFAQAAGQNEAWWRQAMSEPVRQPSLLFAIWRQANGAPAENEKKLIFDFMHSLLENRRWNPLCEEIQKLLNIVNGSQPDELVHYLKRAHWSQWNCFAKSGSSLPAGFLSSESRERKQPDFWHFIFRLPFNAPLLEEISKLDENLKQRVFKLSVEKQKSEAFEQIARRSW